MLKKMNSFTKRASSIAQKSQFIIEVQKIIFTDLNDNLIGSEVNISSDEITDGITSFIIKKGQIEFYKSFSLNATLYKDKKDMYLEKQRKLYIKIKSRKDTSFRSFGTLILDLAPFAMMNGPQEVSVGINDCIVSAAIASLIITHTSNNNRELNSNLEVSCSTPNSTPPTTISTATVPSSYSPPNIIIPDIQPSNNQNNNTYQDQVLCQSPLTPYNRDIVPVERRNSMQRRSSLRMFKSIDEDESSLNHSYHNSSYHNNNMNNKIDNNDEEERSNRATKELVERVQKQNEDFKKSNTQLKSQLDNTLNELIQAKLERAELLTELDRQKLEKRLLKDKLQWYEWTDSIWEITRYLSISIYGNDEKEESTTYPPEPDLEELKDTE